MTARVATAGLRGSRPWAFSAVVTMVWAVAVAVTGQLGRVADNLVATFTMVFGSFLSGSSPLGGGTVAFPVFTKALDVPASVARSFALCIQAVGLTAAVVSIVTLRGRLHLQAVVIGAIAATSGLLVGAAWWGDPQQVFWPSTIGTGWIKAMFSVVLSTTAVLMVRHLRIDHVHPGHGIARAEPLEFTTGVATAFAAAAAAGGALSSLTGTGANIVVFLFLMVVVGESPRVALPTAITVMAAVSLTGLALFGLVDGQLAVEVTGDRVTEVGGTSTDLPADRFDLLGFWLAAVPVVVWGAPLGSFVAARVREHALVTFIAVLATIEVATTVVLVDEMRSDPAVALFLAIGIVAVPVGVVGGARLVTPRRATTTARAGPDGGPPRG